MPKDRTHPHSSLHRSKASPYSRSSKHKEKSKPKSTFPSVGDEREWEDAKCPICLEHPHNAILLFCSSHEKGCRPYMCDTSRRHSNCLDQFRKTSSSIRTTDPKEEVSNFRNFRKLEHKLPCPLCRGQISGWVVVEPARSLMNLKKRSCSLESCDFCGTYSELRVHARDKHPSLRPSEADPSRQEEWARLENETTYQDLLELETDSLTLEDYYSFFQDIESDSEWEWQEMMDLGMELELPLSFNDMPVFHSDPYCPNLMTHLDWSPITRDFNLETESDNRGRRSSERSSSLNRGPRPPNRRY